MGLVQLSFTTNVHDIFFCFPRRNLSSNYDLTLAAACFDSFSAWNRRCRLSSTSSCMQHLKYICCYLHSEDLLLAVPWPKKSADVKVIQSWNKVSTLKDPSNIHQQTPIELKPEGKDIWLWILDNGCLRQKLSIFQICYRTIAQW